MDRDIGQWLQESGQQLNKLSMEYSNMMKKVLILRYVQYGLLGVAILCGIGLIFLIYHAYSENRRMEQYDIDYKQKKRELKKMKRLLEKGEIDPEDIDDLRDELDDIESSYDYSKRLKDIVIKRCYFVAALGVICIIARVWIVNSFISGMMDQITQLINPTYNQTQDMDSNSDENSLRSQEIDDQYDRIKKQAEEKAQKQAEEEARYKELTQEAYKTYAGVYRGFVYDGTAYVDVQLRADGSCTSPFYTYSDGDSANHEGTWTVVPSGNQKINLDDAKINIILNWEYNGQSYSAAGTLFNGYRLNINGIDYLYNKHIGNG